VASRRPACALAALVLLAGCGGGDSETTATQQPTPTTKAPSEKAVGIGDQGAAFFSAPLFKKLNVDKSRIVVPWDTMTTPSQRALTDQWLAAAKKAGVEPLVTFGASRVKPKVLPSVDQFRSAFAAFRKRYPDVKVYAPWNEINHKSQPTADHPARAAAYYEVVRDACKGCTVLAADVLDQAGMPRYVQRFRAAVHGPTPQLWGLHNYSDTNRFRTKGTREMLRAVPGEIWVTETGGVAKFGRSFPFDLKRQARATAYTFKLLDLSSRIRRLYLYNWTGSPPGARFDAGLTNADGSPRPAYATLTRELR
jgi:hypothetical protein